MTFSLKHRDLKYRDSEYHDVVISPATRSYRRSIPLSLALFGICIAPLLLSSSPAQIGSSSAGSAHSASVAPPTALSVAPPTGVTAGRSGFTPSASGFTHPTTVSHSPNVSRGNGDGHHHPRRDANGTAYYPYVYALPVPYGADTNNADTSDDADDDSEYQGGPTIFDRRGSGPDSYIPPSFPGPAHAQPAHSQDVPQDAPVAESTPDPPQPSTTLVFKDGHQLEVSNYAIVSQTLFDLSSGHPRKIALSDLDISATQKQNDDHGVVFQLPPPSQAN
jgi:hypothetical protein